MFFTLQLSLATYMMFSFSFYEDQFKCLLRDIRPFVCLRFLFQVAEAIYDMSGMGKIGLFILP
jgi:hypothetical protein